MGVPSCCLCSSHDSGVSTPSAFSQSKNTLGRSLNQLEISFPRPNVKTILFPIPSLPPIYTQIRTSPFTPVNLTCTASCGVLINSLDTMITSIKGFSDILPEEVGAWQRVESVARRVLKARH